MSLYSIILAAGEGKRMNSKLPKPLQIAAGKTLIDRVINAVSSAGSEKNIVVVGHMADKIKEHLGNSVDYALQSEQLGTGHAVMKGIASISDCQGNVFVMCGDTPLITAETLTAAYKMHISNGYCATIITADCDNPIGYGRIVRNNGNIVKIVEEKDATAEEKLVTEINSGMYIFDIQKLNAALSSVTNNNTQREYYLTDVTEVLLKAGEKVGSYTADFNETLGVNDRIQLAEADTILNKRTITRLMKDGVSILNPESVRVDEDVKIGRDTVIYPNTIIEGSVEIGEDCIIGPNTKIINCTIGNNTEVQSSVALDSTIGSNTNVGPFAYIRPNSKIGNNIKVGDFVEIKNASIGNDTKISHLTYVGDADVGERVNFGCGTVIVNYDGINKHRTTIGDDCFIGCNTNLVSPVTVSKGGYTAAGSTITDDVPEYALAIARSRQVVKDGWAKGKKK